jgi:hypothetical protein
MRKRIGHLFLLVAFALCVGHAAWHGWLGPPVVPEYQVGGEMPALAAPRGSPEQLYLRRQIYLPQQPRQAWIQVIGRDTVELFVNGKLVQRQRSDTMPVGMIEDVTPYLQVGLNTIAIDSHQTSEGHGPRVAVDGAYMLSDGEHSLGVDGKWRCSTSFQRGIGGWWFSSSFEDRTWPLARVVTSDLRCVVNVPPRTRIATSFARWISSPNGQERRVGFRRNFALAGRPSRAWIRVTSFAPYRLAVNGNLLAEQEDQMGTIPKSRAVQRNYDLTSVVQSGKNTISLLVQTVPPQPSIMADVEVEDASGAVHRFDTDEHWLACAGVSQGWIDDGSATAINWEPCRVEMSDLGVQPWQVVRTDVGLVLPLGTVVERAIEQAAIIALVGILAALACRLVAQRFAVRAGAAGPALAFLPLVLPTVALAGSFLLQYDPRILRQDVYRAEWMWFALASVPVQWLILAAILHLFGRRMTIEHCSPTELEMQAKARQTMRRWSLILAVGGLLVAGFWLRYRLITSEPLYPDEVTLYNYAHGWWDRGFASMQISKDLPMSYNSGCELESVGTALALPFFSRDDYVVRFPTVCYGTLTILLMFLIGSRLFDWRVGLVAAGLYTFSPYCCEMTCFGRYHSQTQLLTLVTLYLYYRTVEGRGPINHRYLCWTALSFCALYLSWEGAAFFAVPLLVFAVIYRRGRLRTIFADPAIWIALAMVLSVVLFQAANQFFQQVKYLIVGTGWGDMKPRAMWKYTFFKPWRFAWQASLSTDTLLPLLGVVGAMLMTFRHRWRHPLRLILLCFLMSSLLLALLLPMIETYYSYFLIPLVILLGSAALIAGMDRLIRWSALRGLPGGVAAYARCVYGLCCLIAVALGSGMLIDMRDLSQQTVFLNRFGCYGQWKYPHLREPAEYIAEHFRPGDIVIALQPETLEHYSANAGKPIVCDYGLETVTTLFLLMPDSSTMPVHRTSGTPMLTSLEGLKDVFAHHHRIWYYTVPGGDLVWNSPATMAFLEDNMDPVCENFRALVMLRDLNRPAASRQIERQVLDKAQADLFRNLGTL